jgi:hypothetical protein
MRFVLQRCKEEGLNRAFRNASRGGTSSRGNRCFFGLHKMQYLGYTVSACEIPV